MITMTDADLGLEDTWSPDGLTPLEDCWIPSGPLRLEFTKEGNATIETVRSIARQTRHRARRYLSWEFALRLFRRVAQLSQSAGFDLPDSLLGHADLSPYFFQGKRVLPPLQAKTPNNNLSLSIIKPT